MVPKKKDKLTMQKALRYLMFIEEKTTMRDHSKERYMLSISVTGGYDDVMHHRCKRTKAFLHADMKDTVQMVIE